MTRREFSTSLAGVAASPGLVSSPRSQIVILRAVAGACLPQTLLIETTAEEFSAIQKMRESVWELRTYRSDIQGLAGHLPAMFRRAGIRPLLTGTKGPNLTYLIPFESLTARERAWTALNNDPEWTGARPRFNSYQFGLYRVAEL